MRLLLIVVILTLLLVILGFAITNLETRVPITFWEATYQDVPLWSVVFISVLVGIVSVGIIAVADGGFLRLRNRQLLKENRRLESELNWLRTQPAAGRKEPDVPLDLGSDDEEGDTAGADPAADDALGGPASAPVYQPDEGDDETEDPYTGGRAV
jgi:uncharacterized integral membrane protein